MKLTCYKTVTLVPDIFLDFSPCKMREAEKNQEKPLGPGYVIVDDIGTTMSPFTS